MTGLRAGGLQIDDPLSPGRSAERPDAAAEQAAEGSDDERAGGGGRSNRPPSTKRSARSAGRQSAAARPRRKPAAAPGNLPQANGAPWREWSGLTGVGSFRLPHELLDELGDTARELQLPVGLIVTAAITQLLDQPPDTIVVLVDRADDARIQGRRRTRRRRRQGADD